MLNQYPDHSAKIVELYSADEDFRVLCNDFYSIGEALDQSRSTSIKDKEYESEFLQVFLDLQKELNILFKRTRK